MAQIQCLRQDWFRDVSLLGFLRDVGKHARVGTMLSRESVRSRMEADNEGMSFTECAPGRCVLGFRCRVSGFGRYGGQQRGPVLHRVRRRALSLGAMCGVLHGQL